MAPLASPTASAPLAAPSGEMAPRGPIAVSAPLAALEANSNPARAPVASAVAPGSEQVLVRTTGRPAVSRIELRQAKDKAAFEAAQAKQRKQIIYGSVGAAVLLVVIIALTSPSAPPETTEDPALAERRDHLNPLQSTEGPKPAPHPAPQLRPKVDYSPDTTPKPAPKPTKESHNDSHASPAPPREPRNPAPDKAKQRPPIEIAMTPSAPEKPKPPKAQPGAAMGGLQDKADPEKAAALDKDLLKARGALAGRNITLAHDSLADAEPLIQTREQHDRVEQCRLMLLYVRGFWDAVRKSMAGLQPTDELKIGSTTVSVVSADERELVVHRGPRNETYRIETMPAGIAKMLAERWFNQNDPVNKVYLGAFQAVDPAGEIADVRRLWEQASSKIDQNQLRLLMSYLDLPPVAPIGGSLADAKVAEAKSEKSSLAAAEKEFTKKYGPDIRAADDSTKKLDLAQKLLGEYKMADEGAEQVVVFRGACDQATKACMTAKTEETAKTAAERALEIVDIGIEEKRFEPLKSLAQAAITAARKSKDEDLIKRATEEGRKLATAQK